MASGRPVIAFKKGGALETVKENLSGLFFEEQTEASLNSAIDFFEDQVELFDPQSIRDYVESFSKDNFKRQIDQFVERTLHS